MIKNMRIKLIILLLVLLSGFSLVNAQFFSRPWHLRGGGSSDISLSQERMKFGNLNEYQRGRHLRGLISNDERRKREEESKKEGERLADLERRGKIVRPPTPGFPPEKEIGIWISRLYHSGLLDLDLYSKMFHIRVVPDPSRVRRVIGITNVTNKQAREIIGCLRTYYERLAGGPGRHITNPIRIIVEPKDDKKLEDCIYAVLNPINK